MQQLQKVFEEFQATDESFKPDKWQESVLNHRGNITIRAGRQSGKSEVISRKAAKFACEEGGKSPSITILILAASQRQSSMIFIKTLSILRKVNDLVLQKSGPI